MSQTSKSKMLDRFDIFKQLVREDIIDNYKEGICQYPRDLDDLGLVCYGCAHSASSIPFPGLSSGETACMTCIRNREDPGNDESPKIEDNYLSLNVLDKIISMNIGS